MAEGEYPKKEQTRKASFSLAEIHISFGERLAAAHWMSQEFVGVLVDWG